MDGQNAIFPDNADPSCMECGEQEFKERGGLYYCQQCGTKLCHVPEMEMEHEKSNDTNISTKHKSVKYKGPELTAWECYNYILRGYVDKLISFGAKEELKLMTLQVWAAYLRSMNVAFYNKNHSNQVKSENNAVTNNNHSKDGVKKRKRKSSDRETNCTSDVESVSTNDNSRPNNEGQRNDSLFAKTSESEDTVLTTSSSGNTTNALLDTNVKPSKYIRKTTCRKNQKIKIDSATRDIERTMLLINLKQVLCVLGIALNLIQDDIQLCDLIRFVNEGRISLNSVLQYFPENIPRKKCKEMLQKINFFKNPDKYMEKPIRLDIGRICKNIGIEKLKTPDIMKLIRRYVTELCLPTEIATYCERLINMCLPEFDTRAKGLLPAYEARAMAYIIFVLKLLFGLDGEKENSMSQASKKLNRKIEQLNRKHNEKQPLLFVWNEWVQYIEMRKVVVSHFNPNFCLQFKQCQSTKQLLEQMAEEIAVNAVQNNNKSFNDVEFLDLNQRLKNFKILFERFRENLKNTLTENEQKRIEKIDFQPSLTPGFSYFKSIQLHCDNKDSLKSNFVIPKFMRIDHTQREISLYLKVKPLIKYFHKHHKELKAFVLPSNQNRCYIGVFSAPRPQFVGSAQTYATRSQKACFIISEEKWAENVAENVCNTTDDLEYKTDLKSYSKLYMSSLKLKKFYDENMDYELPTLWNEDLNKNTSNDINLLKGYDLDTMHSFDLFKEDNMDPIKSKDFIKRARKDLDQIDLFEDISDEECVLSSAKSEEFVAPPTSDDEEFSNINKEIYIKQEEFLDIEDTSNKNSKSHKDKTLKFYISNMDCWMLLGRIPVLTKGQRAQLHDQFPRSFSWLLETCAQTLNIEWSAVYEQLLTIELMFCLRIEDPDKIKNCVYMKSFYPIKELNTLLFNYGKIW